MRTVDELERMAKQAMFNRYAQNAKRATEKKMFDAAVARKRLLSDSEDWKDSRDPKVNVDRYRKAQAAMKAYTMKGG